MSVIRRVLCFLLHYRRHWRLVSVECADFSGINLNYYCLRCLKYRGIGG